MYSIGIDMGGTKLAAGVVGADGTILHKLSVPTGEPDATVIAAKTEELIFRLLTETGLDLSGVGVIGIGVPGTANQQTGMIEYANNLGMEDVPFLELLRPYFKDTPMVLENDANAAAYAEFLFGAGRGSRSMVMVTLGTGIGAGIIINGELYEGVNYAAGEIGHTVIDTNGSPCSCGRRGCFECYASASALCGQARDAMRADRGSLLWELCHGDIALVDGMMFFDAVRRGDVTAMRVFERYTEHLAVGLSDVVNFLQPELIVIGGGISREGEFLLAPVREQMEHLDYARTSRRRTVMRSAALGNDAGIIGAAHLAKWRRERAGIHKS